jgi:short-subunit dehydrogenase
MKNIIITGATKGIGRAIAETFATRPSNILVTARTISDLEEMKNYFSIHFPFCNLTVKSVDHRLKEDNLNFAHFALEHFSKIDIIIHNAGIFTPGVTFEEPKGSLEKLMETNLYSVYYLNSILVPKLISQGSGHIFHMCSIASLKAFPNGGSYAISKWALLGYTRCLREELKEFGIKITAIIPGATWSDSWKGVDLPKERLMESEDIAKMVMTATELGPSALVEDIILRPIKGDL